MSNTSFPVPASEDEVTKEWLQFALSDSFPDATFASLECERIGETYGFASRIFRYRWRNNRKTQPESVVVKLWETAGKHGDREVLFYQTFRNAGIRVPACYYSAADGDTQKAILVLEDLSDAIQGDVFVPLEPARAEEIACSLAKFHATWLQHPKLAELSWIPDLSTWNRDIDWFQPRRARFLERFPDHLNGLARLLLDKIELAPVVSNARLSEAPKTLLHGDFHLDNLLFENETEPVFLDWSRPIIGTPARNLVRLLLFMAPLLDFDDLFDCYLDGFNQVSNKPFPPKALEKQLGGELLRAFAISTCGIARWQPVTERGARMLGPGIKKAKEAVEFWQKRDPALFSFLC